MSDTLERVEIGAIAPLFIVSDIARSLAHYARLGFACEMAAPEEQPFFAIVARGQARLMLKEVGDGVAPLPNPARHPWAPWDGFVHTAEPEALAAEMGLPAETRDDGLKGVAVADPDGYTLFFGRPV